MILMGSGLLAGAARLDAQRAGGARHVSASDLDLIRLIDDPDEVIEAVFDFYQHRGFYATA